jgi:hypothetical protein
VFAGGFLQHALGLRDDFLAHAIAGDRRYCEGLHATLILQRYVGQAGSLAGSLRGGWLPPLWRKHAD